MFLGSEEIKRLIIEENLVSNYVDLDTQLQPDGFDLTVNKIEEYCSAGIILKDTKFLPVMKEIELTNCIMTGFDNPELTNKTKDLGARKIWYLHKGVYLLYFNEEIKLPKSISAIHIQRSTLARCGSFSIVGTWDMGYNGKGCTMIEVCNPHGLVLEKNTRIVKMHFITVAGEGKLYNGSYQKENL